MLCLIVRLLPSFFLYIDAEFNCSHSVIDLSVVMQVLMFRLISAPYVLRPPNMCMINTRQFSLERSHHPNIFISLLFVISLFKYHSVESFISFCTPLPRTSVLKSLLFQGAFYQ
jgi:hypothetical protein